MRAERDVGRGGTRQSEPRDHPEVPVEPHDVDEVERDAEDETDQQRAPDAPTDEGHQRQACADERQRPPPDGGVGEIQNESRRHGDQNRSPQRQQRTGTGGAARGVARGFGHGIQPRFERLWRG